MVKKNKENNLGMITFIIIVFIVVIVAVILITPNLMDERDRDINFCEKKGFGSTSGFNEDRGEIWCGYITIDGPDGITYPVTEGLFGQLKVEDGFDPNEFLRKLRFFDACENECGVIHQSPISRINNELQECYCYFLNDGKEKKIDFDYTDITEQF